MKSYAGYRGTSPPNLFVAFNRDELDMDFGTHSAYQDPLDLKNTFLKWEFGFDGNLKGLGKLTLINPGSQIEDKLFSWYAALAPKSWTAKERGDSVEEIAKKAEEISDFYIRWGYQSSPDHAVRDIENADSGDTTALSHIHKFKLLDMSYQINDRSDRVVTLSLVNEWDLSYNNTSFVQRERLFEFPLVDDSGVMRKPATLIQEFLLQLVGAHAQYKGYSKWTDDQFAALNADFNEALALKMKPGEDGEPADMPSLKLPDNAADLYVKYSDANATDSPPSKNWVVLDTIKEWFGQFGMTPSFKAVFEGSENDPATKKTSSNQGKGAPDQGPPDDPNLNAVENAENQLLYADEFSEPVMIMEPTNLDYNPLAMAMSIPPGTPLPMGAPTPYFMVLRDKHGIAKTDLTSAQISVVQKTNKYWSAVHPAMKNLVQDEPWAKASKYMAWNMAVPAPVPSEVGEVPEPALPLEYTLVPGGMVDISLTTADALLTARKQEKVDELHEANEVQAKQKEQFEDLEAVNEDGSDAEFVPPLPPRTHTLQFVSTNLTLNLQSLTAHLNDKYFKSISRYLQSGQLEFANVPKGARPSVEEALGAGFDGMDWEKDAGMLLLTDSNHMSEIFAWANLSGDINSFPIQSRTNPNTISLATGFNSRPDNIITGLQWRMDSGSMFLELQNTPMIIQKLYNVAKRFEDPEYRDVVMGTLVLNLRFNNAQKSTLEGDGNGSGGIEAPELHNQKDAVGMTVFPDLVVQTATAQAVTMTSTSSASQDQADVSEAAKKSLVEQVQEDLRFISDEQLTDIFFPRVSPDAQDSITTRMAIITPQGEEDVDSSKSVPYFRYVTKSPISVLQKSLEAGGLEATKENAVLVQAKMQAMNIFKHTITDIKLTTLGVPEMDIFDNEVQNRSVALWVHEPRVPGTYHWLTGMYTMAYFTHKIDSTGYSMELNLLPKNTNTADEMAKYTFLQVGSAQ